MHSNHQRIFVIVLAMLAIALVGLALFPAHAQPAPPPAAQSAPAQASAAPAAAAAAKASASTSSESDEKSTLEKQASLWKTKAELTKYKADVAEAEARIQRANTGGAVGAPGVPTSGVTLSGNLPAGTTPPAPAASGVSGKPRLLYIGVAGTQHVAHIEVDGRPADVVVGDPVEGGWTVASIDAAHVKLVRGKRVLVL
ncbi:type IV pilus biogenesis protein PilP [Ralstonia pseudosolanacearum]|uniref:type IV pilus biogenesis protein PilP n=1 Tax=Ralstonia pseudosolanacearum TaxID=1310165 RepID=UPI0018D19EE9|nr:type IV pilus biogenesis protein PilP [Ralstonia pseudosolanacearum]